MIVQEQRLATTTMTQLSVTYAELIIKAKAWQAAVGVIIDPLIIKSWPHFIKIMRLLTFCVMYLKLSYQHTVTLKRR